MGPRTRPREAPPNEVPHPPCVTSGMPTPQELADALRSLTHSYAEANRGSAEHPLGKATVGTLQEIIPQAKAFPGVLQGYAIRFEDGSTYLVNVHLIPGSTPNPSKQATPAPEGGASPPPQGA